MRKIITVLIIALASSSFALAQTIEHIVKKGETLESIATLYNVTKEQIVSVNPSSAKFIYTGQKLIIPSMKADNAPSVPTYETNSVEVDNKQQIVKSQEPWDLSAQTPTTNEIKSVPNTDSQRRFNIMPCLDFGYFDINFPIPEKSFNWGQHYSIGASFVFDDIFSFSFDIGYKWNSATASENNSGYSINSKSVTHFIQFSPSIGIGDLDILALNLGVDFDCFLGGNEKLVIDKETYKEKISATGVKPLVGPKISLTIGHYYVAYSPLFSSGNGLSSHLVSLGIRY